MEHIPGLSAAADPVTDGTYVLRCEAFNKTHAKSSGKLMYAVRFVVTDDGPFQGRGLFHNFNIDPENPIGIRQLRLFLKAAGVVCEDDAFDPSDCLQTIVKAAVELGENRDTGEPVERIKRFFAA